MDYFEAYNDKEVHRLMLSDKIRMDSYHKAIQGIAHLIKDRVVVDVGGGTGVLSIMAAKAGAKRVYCIEGSDMYELAEQMMVENGVEDVVKVIHKVAEDVTKEYLRDLEFENKTEWLDENAKEVGVDVLVSEWMGFHLLHENMLSSVIEVRDKLMIPHGPNNSIAKWQMLPSYCTLSVSLADVHELYRSNHGLSDSVSNEYGINVEKLGVVSQPDNPHIVDVPESAVTSCTGGEDFWTIDLTNCLTSYMDTIDSIGTMVHCFKQPESGFYHGFVFWFKCCFYDEKSEVSCLSTQPGNATHWKQSMIWMPSTLDFPDGYTLDVEIEIAMRRDEENERHIVIDLEVERILCDEDVQEDD